MSEEIEDGKMSGFYASNSLHSKTARKGNL
jgi:hypothetical protein